MEPITHFLTGACIGRAGLNRKTALATATLTLAAEAPDIDVFGRFGGPVFGFAHHRGFTHSFLGAALMAGVVLLFMYGVYLLRRKKHAARYAQLPPRWGLLYIYAYMAGLSHILLDFTNNYGVRPLWPFSEKWYSWDIVFIVEPVLWIALIGGLLLPGLFSLINEEVGLRKKGPHGRAGALVALVIMVLTWAVRDFEHRRAIAAMEARTYQDQEAVRVSAYPYWVNPFRWYGVVETKDFFGSMGVDSLTPEVDPTGTMSVRFKPEETPVTLAAKKSYLGRVYLDWAQYPVTETEALEHNSGYIVRFSDLRYAYPERIGGSRKPLSAGVELDSNLNVVRAFTGEREGDGKN